MTAISSDLDAVHCGCCHHRAFLAPDIAHLSHRPVVKPIDLVNPIKTPLLDHELGSIHSLFCWLEEQPDFFVAGNVADFLEEERHKAS